MANRVTFLVDGFNLYFSVRHAEAALRASHLHWLDVSGLLSSFLYLFGRGAILAEIHFFTALPFHRHRYDPGIVHRHERHLQALKTSGVQIHIADRNCAPSSGLQPAGRIARRPGGRHTGRACCSMYWRSTATGAPPTLAAK